MDIRIRIENLDIITSTSFATTSLRLYGIDFAGNDGSYVSMVESSLNQLLVEIMKGQKIHNSLKFNQNDVVQWIDDFKEVILYYKQVNRITHIPSGLKLRDLIKQVRNNIISSPPTPQFQHSNLTKEQKRAQDIENARLRMLENIDKKRNMAIKKPLIIKKTKD